VLRRREEWFEGQLDLDPERLIFIDETGTSTNMARLRGRAPRGERLRAGCGRPLRCKKNLEQGAARDRVLPCVRPLTRRDHMPRARMGVRGSGPHHWNALEALTPCAWFS
jgi:hypothetical protein